MKRFAYTHRRPFFPIAMALLAIVALSLYGLSFIQKFGLTKAESAGVGVTVRYRVVAQGQAIVERIDLPAKPQGVLPEPAWDFFTVRLTIPAKIRDVALPQIRSGNPWASGVPGADGWLVAVSIWPLALCAGAYLVVVGRRIATVVRVRQRLRRGHCPACGFDLRASSDRCPECGREHFVARASRP